MQRNIKLAYFLAFLKNSWFWLGIWVFYYLRFTNYAGIGLIEMSLIIAMTISEIPTGAVADLFGKKKTLFISFVMQAIGGFIMAFAPSVSYLIIAVFIMGVGGSFYSGTLEALVFDSLKENGLEHNYHRIISRINSISLIAPAICGIIGGYLYLIQPNLPFLANSFSYTIAFFLCLFLIEPKINTLKVSVKNFLLQSKHGFNQLFTNKLIRSQLVTLLSTGIVIVVCDEMLNSFLGVEFKFRPESLGMLWASIYLLSAFASQLTPYINKYIPFKYSIILIGVLVSVSLVFSPWLGLILGGLFLLIRSSLQAIYRNISSVIINENTESRYRATTLSTFNLLNNIPYVLLAFFLGSLADFYSARILASILGIILLLFLLYPVLNLLKKPAFLKHL